VPGQLVRAQSFLDQTHQYQQAVDQRLDQYTLTQAQAFQYSTDGADVLYYRDGQNLVKIEIRMLGESGKLFRSFYMKNQAVLLVSDRAFQYNVPYYLDSVKATELGLSEFFDPNETKEIQARFYFLDNQLAQITGAESHTQRFSIMQWGETLMAMYQELQILEDRQWLFKAASV